MKIVTLKGPIHLRHNEHTLRMNLQLRPDQNQIKLMNQNLDHLKYKLLFSINW